MEQQFGPVPGEQSRSALDKTSFLLIGAFLVVFLGYQVFYFAPRQAQWEKEQAVLRQQEEAKKKETQPAGSGGGGGAGSSKKKSAKPKKRSRQAQSVSDQVYEINKILDARWKNGKREFLISWKGYGDGDNTWEPEDR